MSDIKSLVDAHNNFDVVDYYVDSYEERISVLDLLNPGADYTLRVCEGVVEIQRGEYDGSISILGSVPVENFKMDDMAALL